jgi:predicted secreted protein
MANFCHIPLAAVLLVGMIAPVSAQPAAAPAGSQPAAEKPKSDEKICQKIELVGSRLAVKKVCMTRAEWADRQLTDRQDLEKVQVQRGMKGE